MISAVIRFIKLAGVFVLFAVAWVVLTVVLAFYGWWLQPVVPQDKSAECYQWAVQELQSRNPGSASLMLIEEGQPTHEHHQPRGTRSDTLFPTASFSKFITAPTVLLKAPRSNTDREIRVGIGPGSEFLYSGGGYLLLQLLIEEVTGEDFAN